MGVRKALKSFLELTCVFVLSCDTDEKIFCSPLKTVGSDHQVLASPLFSAQTWQPLFLWLAVGLTSILSSVEHSGSGQIIIIFIYFLFFFTRPTLYLTKYGKIRGVAEEPVAPLGWVLVFIHLCSCLLARWQNRAGCCLPPRSGQSDLVWMWLMLRVNSESRRLALLSLVCPYNEAYKCVCVRRDKKRGWWPLCCLGHNDKWDC